MISQGLKSHDEGLKVRSSGLAALVRLPRAQPGGFHVCPVEVSPGVKAERPFREERAAQLAAELTVSYVEV